MAKPTSGVVTFLFTDIEGSTRLVGRLGPAYAELLGQHHRIVRSAVAAASGHEVKTEGDSFFVLFDDAAGAVRAAVDAQRGLASATWPEGEEVRVRMGLHTGAVELVAGEYVGIELHRAARIAAAAHGGQVIISEAVHDATAARLPDGVRTRDLGEHRLRDIEAPIHLHQLEIEGLRVEFPPVASLSARFEVLPRELTAFVGRDAEVSTASDLLSGSRLLTMTGPGGTGKSRLAIRVARHCAESFHDGVAFVPLAPIEDPDLVVPTIRSTLGFAEEPGRAPLETLIEQLRAQQLLLILDNFEQVLPAADTVAELMAATDEVTVMVTSRAALRIDGEQEFAVPPLELPDLDADLDAIGRSEAVRLFVERARLARPDFTLDAGNAEVVARIVARLEGLPLAIELAASRIKLLTPEALLGRLSTRLDGLGAVGTAGRRRTLRGTIDWSHGLLGPAEQAAFRRLAVFTGGATLDAVEAVVPADDPDDAVGADAIGALGALVDHSLVRHIEGERGSRYGMLETLREYGLERLTEAGEHDLIAGRHADWYLGRVHELAPGFTSGPEGLDELEADHDNVRAATQRMIDRGDTQSALAAVSDLWRFWHLRGHLREGLDVCGAVMDLPGVDAPTEPKAGALYAHASLLYWQGESAPALASYLDSLEVARAAGATAREAEAQFALAYAYMISKDWDEAHASAREAVRLYAELGDRLGEVNSRYADAYASALRGDYARAIEDFRAVIEVVAATGDRFWLMNHRVTLAWALTRVGEIEEANELFRGNLEGAIELGDASMQGMAIDGFATTAALAGDHERALHLAGAAAAIADELGGGAPDELVISLDAVALVREAGVDEADIGRLLEEGRALDREAARDLALTGRPA